MSKPLHSIAVLAAILTLTLLAWGHAWEGDLRDAELDRLDRRLEVHARAIVAQLDGERLAEGALEELDAIADRAGRATGLRVTLIDATGRVRGDSDVPFDRLPAIENHADRLEVRAARAEGVGLDTRTSDTVGRELRYLALSGPEGVVRVSGGLGEVHAAVARFRSRWLGFVALAVVGSLALFQGLWWLTYRRPLRELRQAAQRVARGQFDERLPRPADRDLASITSSIQEIAAHLRARLGEVTRENERFGAVLEGMVEGVLVVDARDTILVANSRLRELFEITTEIVGRPLLEGVRNADLEALLAEAARSDQTVARSIVFAGTPHRTVQVHAARFPSEGRREGTVAVLHDVTALMQLEDVRRDFVANASHELRTPLAAIRGFAETLLESANLSQQDQKSYLEVINRHAERLGNIVEDLLALSTIESGADKLEIASVDVEILARNLIADFRQRFEERRVEASLRTEGGALARADPRAVDQVLTNLLDNALKYTEPGGRVDIAIEPRAATLRVSVADSGIGIPKEDLSRVFERFYRVDRARSRALGGTGLGLSIVKHLVQAMRGDIYVESVGGEGSTFTFTLPRG